MEIKIASKLKMQLNHCFMMYGDQPEELLIKLESLLIEWYCKGVNHGIENERKNKE